MNILKILFVTIALALTPCLTIWGSNNFSVQKSVNGYVNEIFNISVETGCAMSIKNQTSNRLTYGCLCKNDGYDENYWISVDVNKEYETLSQTDFLTLTQKVIANPRRISFQGIRALEYDQQEGAILIRHLNFLYKGKVYDVKFASKKDHFDERYKMFLSKIKFK